MNYKYFISSIYVETSVFSVRPLSPLRVSCDIKHNQDLDKEWTVRMTKQGTGIRFGQSRVSLEGLSEDTTFAKKGLGFEVTGWESFTSFSSSPDV